MHDSLDLTSLLSGLSQDCCRLFHGRGGFHPRFAHVAIDWFAPVILITFYQDCSQNETLQRDIIHLASLHDHIKTVVVQDRYLPQSPKHTVFGQLPQEPIALENGLKYHLSLKENQNHGFFLDMSSGRRWVQNHSSCKRVLNLFAYTCSLSVAALAGEAKSVINLDMSRQALAVGKENHLLNFTPATCQKVSYLGHNLFKTWGRLKREGPFDLIIIDPPSRQPGSFVAEKDYARIVRRLPELSHPTTQIMACLNSPYLGASFLHRLFEDYQLITTLDPARGFADKEPERGLKSMVFEHV